MWVVSLDAVLQPSLIMLKCHLGFFFWLLAITTANVDKGIGGAPLLLEATRKLVEDAPWPLATGSNFKMFDLDEDNKAKANVVARGIVVSLAGGTLHGILIEEGNVSVRVSSIEPRTEFVLLYEGNNDDDDPPMVRLGDALKSITKWPMEALQAILEKPQQAI